MVDDFFKRAGSVLGIGVGSMEILLPKTVFLAGAVVEGQLVLRLAEPVKASSLVARVEATEEHRKMVPDGRGGTTERVVTETTYSFEQFLGGARSYFDQKYELALPLPPRIPSPLEIAADALGRVEPSDTLGQVGSIVSAMAHGVRAVREMQKPVKWRVSAVLDIPWKRNVRAHADIAVR